MFYRARIRSAAAVSLLLHAAILLPLLAYLLRESPGMPTAEAKQKPIVLSFDDPVDSREPRGLIESGAAAEVPVENSDLISSADSQAQDRSEVEGETNQPHFDEADEFDELGTPLIPPPGENSEVEVVDVPPLETPEEVPEEATPPKDAQQEPTPDTASAEDSVTRVAEVTIDRSDSEALVEPLEAEPEQEEELKEPEEKLERFEVAQGPARQAVQVQEIRSSRGREGGGAEKSGFTSFEANKHELGDYMLHVRREVARHWRANLQLRYAGVSRTYSMVECSIRPDGTLEYVRIIETGESMNYAIICREAIVKAAPFGPFPFDVPDIYRKENLEIVWKFAFL